MSRGAFALSMLLTVAIASSAACRRHDPTDRRVRLRFSGYVGNPSETGLMAELIRDFNASQREIEVTYEPIPGQYYPKLLAMLVSETAPDVFYLDNLYFKPFHAKKKILLSLEPFLAKSAATKKEDFLPQLIRAFSADDVLYGIPKDFNAYALFYNKALFDAAGMAYPDDTWDLDRLRDAAIRLTKPGGPYGFVLDQDKTSRYLPIANGFGAELFGSDGRCTLASSEGIRALDFYTGLKLKDRAAIYPGEVGATYAEDAFGRQLVAMAYDGSWMIGYLAESNPEVRYGVAELPRGPKGRSNFVFTVSYSIAKSSRHPDEAWKLIEFLTSEAAQARITWALPSRRAASERYVDAHPEYAPVLKGSMYGRPWEFGAKGNRVEARLGVAMQEVFLGVKSSEAALKGACAEIDRIGGL
jgi:multiple sugar transport system substrate-binding protein